MTDEAVAAEFLDVWRTERSAVIERWWAWVQNVHKNKARFADRWASEASVWADFDRAAGTSPRPSDESAGRFLLGERISVEALLRHVRRYRAETTARAADDDAHEGWKRLPLALNRAALWYALHGTCHDAWQSWLEGHGLSADAARAGATAYCSPLARAASSTLESFERAQAERVGPDACARFLFRTGIKPIQAIKLLRTWLSLDLATARAVVMNAGFDVAPPLLPAPAPERESPPPSS